MPQEPAGWKGRALVAAGGVVYFGVAWTIGAMNRDDILILLRKKKAG